MVIKGENTEELIDNFKLRYCILSVNQLEEYEKKNKLKLLNYKKSKSWTEYHAILDTIGNKVEISSIDSMLSKTFLVSEKSDLSFLDKYEVDESYLYQVDKVKPNFGPNGVDKMYGINHIWLAFSYHTKGKKRRMCINTKLFGRNSTIGSRDFILHKLINY